MYVENSDFLEHSLFIVEKQMNYKDSRFERFENKLCM